MENWTDLSVNYRRYSRDGLHLNGWGAALLGEKMTKKMDKIQVDVSPECEVHIENPPECDSHSETHPECDVHVKTTPESDIHIVTPPECDAQDETPPKCQRNLWNISSEDGVKVTGKNRKI